MNENKILSKISYHLMEHQGHGIDICPMVINRKELYELIHDSFIVCTMPPERRHELMAIEHGYVGKVMGVTLYLWDDNE